MQATTPVNPPNLPSSAVEPGAGGDLHRPQYHFLPPANWMNDPNGIMQWKGQYHLFYQYNPFGADGPGQARMHWGHAVSGDLIHWSDLPIALAPTPGGPDEDGCWSGCAVDHDGVPTIVYSGHRGGKQHTCLARSHDDLLTWEKEPGNPVIPAWPAALDLTACRDPAVWREGDDWFQLLGASIRGAAGAALLYRSRDLIEWEYLHPLIASSHPVSSQRVSSRRRRDLDSGEHPTAVGERDSSLTLGMSHKAGGERETNAPISLGTMWECPGFFPLAERHVFIMAPKDARQLHRPVYLIGDYAEHHFAPEQFGVLDRGSAFYAPQTMRDDRGRRLMWGWLREARSAEAQRAAGWSGVMSLPRALTLLPDGALGSEPAAELTALRGAHDGRLEIDVGPGSAGAEIGIRGRALEIVTTWEPGSARAFGIDVARAPDGAEMTRIRYEPAADRLVVDRRRSSSSEDVQRDELGDVVGLAAGEPLTLRIFLDHSVLEIFANGRACHATRIYPTRADSQGVRLFAEGGSARLARLDVWELASIWDAESERYVPSSVPGQMG